MFGSRESLTRRASGTAVPGSLGRIAASLVAIAAFTGSDTALAAPSQLPSAPQVVADSGAAYVSTLSTSSTAGITVPEVVIEPPSEEPRAAAYARRYNISRDLALDIVENALREGIDPELGFRLIRVESVFRVSARGPQGSLGLTQLMPGTARSIDRSLDTEREILDPERNLRTGFRYLRQMIERYKDVRLGVLAYNRGETAVDRALRRGADPENGYSHKVLGTRSSNPYTGSGLVPRTAARGGS